MVAFTFSKVQGGIILLKFKEIFSEQFLDLKKKEQDSRLDRIFSHSN